VKQFFLSNNDLWIRAGPGVGKTSTMILNSGLLSDGLVVIIVPTISLCQSILQDSQRMRINALEYMPSNEVFWNNNVASLRNTKLVVSVIERSYGSGRDDFSTWLQHLYNHNMLVAIIFDEVQNLIESISFRPSMIGIMDFQQRVLCRAIYISGSLSRYQLSLLQSSLSKRNPSKHMETIATPVTLDNCDYFEAVTVPAEVRSIDSLVKYSVKKILDVLKNGLHIILPRASKGTRQSPPKRVLVIMSFSVELATKVYHRFLTEVEQEGILEDLKTFLIHGEKKEDIDEAIHSLGEDDSDKIVITFSTSVMGTGVNTTGVQWVINVGGTRGLSELFQTAGRGGRNGSKAIVSIWLAPWLWERKPDRVSPEETLFSELQVHYADLNVAEMKQIIGDECIVRIFADLTIPCFRFEILRRFNKGYDFFVPYDRNCSACSFCFDASRQNSISSETMSTNQSLFAIQQNFSEEPSSTRSTIRQVSSNQETDRRSNNAIQPARVQQSITTINSSSSERTPPIQNTSNHETGAVKNLSIGVTQQGATIQVSNREKILFNPSSTHQRVVAPQSINTNSDNSWEGLRLFDVLKEFDKIMENISQYEKEEDCVICHRKGAAACYANNCSIFKGVNMGQCGFCFNRFHTNTEVMNAIRNKDFKQPCVMNCAQLHDDNNRFNLCGSCFRERIVSGKGSSNKTQENYTCSGKCSNLAKSQRLVLLASYFITDIKKDLYQNFRNNFNNEIIKDFRIFFFECMNHSFDFNGTSHPLWKLVLVNFFRKCPQFKFKN
jgi:superfamily II DNA/RNA helicase